MRFSIIIPTYNEQENIGKLLDFLGSICKKSEVEIIVVDGASSDSTQAIVKGYNVEFILSETGRGIQLYNGANKSNGEVMYFLHADTIPPENFLEEIQKAIDQGYESGCFQLNFDPASSLLSFYQFFTRYRSLIFRGGDQSLFIKKSLYYKLGGFNPSLMIMEDIDIIKRLLKQSNFVVLKSKVKSSSKKYLEKGAVKLQLVYAIIHLLFALGVDNKAINKFYKKQVL
ncbi:MAG: TIGR04283 family arsenosugar biosynthesis glycosyltransferase [Salibacteraceae bacterium]